MSVKNNMITAIGIWGTVGFVRGVQSYNYDNPYINALFTDKLVNGTWGTVCYLSPFTCMFMFYKEMYRFEVNLFNIKIEKESNFYKKLFF